jgi:hypothetical protein
MKILLSFKLPHALLIIFYFMKDILNILKDKMEEA